MSEFISVRPKITINEFSRKKNFNFIRRRFNLASTSVDFSGVLSNIHLRISDFVTFVAKKKTLLVEKLVSFALESYSMMLASLLGTTVRREFIDLVDCM